MSTVENKNSDSPITRLYSMKEAAAMWGLSYWTLRALVLDGRIRPIIKVGKGFKFDGSELANAKFERL